MAKPPVAPRLPSRLALLGVILMSVALPAAAQTCDPVGATSLSQACGGPGWCFDSTAQSPIFPPASSSIFHVFTDPTFLDFQVSATGIMDIGSFGATAHASGFTKVDRATHGAGAQVDELVSDCATASGYTGTGVLHIPIHLTGSRSITFTPAGYTPPPPPSPPPSRAQLRILCAAGTVGAGVATPCDDPQLDFETSGDIDTTVELVFRFTFGQPVEFQFGSVLSASIGDPGSGDAEATGLLTGDAEVTLTGTLLPARITDLAGSPLADATLETNSGFDYLTAPEPSGAWAPALIALALQRRMRSRTPR